MNKVGRQELTKEVIELLDRDYTEQLAEIKIDTADIKTEMVLVNEALGITYAEVEQTRENVLDSIAAVSVTTNEINTGITAVQESVNNIKNLRSVSFEYEEKSSNTSTGLDMIQLAGLHSFSFVGTVGDEAYNGVGFYESNPSFAFVQKTVAGGGGIYVQPYSNKIVTSSGDFLTGTITFYYFG